MKSILITGAYGGMGRATAMRFRDMGWRVFALDRVVGEREENIISIKVDVTDDKSVQRAVVSVAQMTDKLDAIIHFAGVYMLDSLIEMPSESYDRIFDPMYFSSENAYRVKFKYFCADANGQVQESDGKIYTVQIKLQEIGDTEINWADRIENPLGLRISEYKIIEGDGDPLDTGFRGNN